jgi:taurine dioxygenase
MEVIPLSSALGAEIRGLDLHSPIDESCSRALRKAWAEFLVLVVRDQAALSADDQIRFCRVFGEIGARARPKDMLTEPSRSPEGMMYVSNRRENGRLIGVLPDGELQFHIDQCFTEAPARGTCLYAIEVPRFGGDTKFGNLYRAWETLPPEVQTSLEGRRATHVFEFDSYDRSNEHKTSEGRIQKATHDVVIRHPDTGRRLLYVNRLMTKAIDGMSDDTLLRLFDHEERDEFIYTHRWRPGDVLLWDNCSTIHARTDFDPSEPRHLRRFTVRGVRLP